MKSSSETTTISASSDFAKYNTAQFSTTAKDFVPTFPMSSDSKEFVPNNAPLYTMGNMYQYSPYVTQNQVPSYCQYGAAQASMVPAQNCMAFNLDDYSDYSSDDDAQEAMKKSTIQTVEPISCLKPMLTEQSVDTNTPDDSICQTESDACSLELDASDNDQDDGQDVSHADVACFSVSTLLRLRHAVPWPDGAEEGLIAEEVAPSEERELQKEPSSPKQNFSKQYPSKQSSSKQGSSKQSTRRDRPATKHDECRRANKVLPKKGPDNSSSSEELHTSDSSWTARQMAHRRVAQTDVGPEPLSNEAVVRTMKSILNKLTIEKFEPLYAKLVSCGIQTTVQLETLIHEVFEKATTQHHFTSMYADLCVRLHSHFSEHPIGDSKTTFKKILLNGCQAFFEKHLKPPANLEELDKDERIALTCKYKMQMLGNIKFVGALLVRQMLATKVLFAICEELLRDPTPESLESLAALLTVVGPKLDIAGWAGHALLVGIFDQLKVLAQTSKISSRVRCLFKDVLELRAAGWHDRKPKKIEGPSTLREVADTQAAEEMAGGTSCKTPAKGAHWSQVNTWRGQQPGQGQGAKTEKAGGKQASSFASDLCRRSTAPPKVSVPSEGYARINSLAALMGGAKGPQAPNAKGTGPERPRKQPNEEHFNKEACRKEVSAAIAELRMTHEVKEAVARISSLSVPSSKQSEELCNMLMHMAEEGSAEVRKASFELVADLFTYGHWKPHALARGLQEFAEEVCPDLKQDIPMLPKILSEELCVALAPLVNSGVLQQSQHAALAVC